MIVAAALLLTLVALVLVLGIFFRASKNVGPLGLEDLAHRERCVYLPVPQKLIDDLQNDWSKPVRLRISTHTHPLLGELTVQPYEGEPT